jgi:hypothetical protein
MKAPRSAYHPPRAPWYRNLREVWYGLTRLDRVPLPGRLGGWTVIRGVLVPGQGWGIMGRGNAGWAVMAGWLVCLVLGLALLGTGIASVLFGVMIFLHATGLVMLFGPWIAPCGWMTRLASGLGMGALLTVFLYMPLQFWVTRNWVLPVTMEGRVVVVQVVKDPGRVRRGDWVLYQQDRVHAGSVRLQEGLSMGPVLGMPGDEVEFLPTGVRSGGRVWPRQEGMPESGSVGVAADSWMIWPRWRVVVLQGLPPEVAHDLALQQSVVAQEKLVGRPFRHWFFRGQILE